jgi:hypothetical protein
MFYSAGGASFGGRGLTTNNSNGQKGSDGFPSYVTFLNGRHTYSAEGGRGGEGGVVGESNSEDDYFAYGGAVPNILPSPVLLIGGPGGVGRASATWFLSETDANSAGLQISQERLDLGYNITYTVGNVIIPPNHAHDLPFWWPNTAAFNGNYNRPSPVAPTGGGGGGGRINTILESKFVHYDVAGNRTLQRQLYNAYLPGRGGYLVGPINFSGMLFTRGVRAGSGDSPNAHYFFNTLIGAGGNGGSKAPNKEFTPENGKKFGGGGGGGGASRSTSGQNGRNGANGCITIIEE